jgi:bacillithiol disulfide reductase
VMSGKVYDLLCVGAGPTGLSCAMEAKRIGLAPVVIDKGCLCNSLYHYPTNMLFFTTSERMEIGGLPMTTAGSKPTRAEALKYYRKAAEHYELELRLYERLERMDGHDGNFTVETLTADGAHNSYRAKKVVLATGYYDRPNLLGVPGEDLPHVSHYYTDSHPYWGQEVVVVGAQNSAAEVALDLFRGGARVTLVHRGAALGKSLKYWVRPDLENRIKAGEIHARLETQLIRIEPGRVWTRSRNGEEALPAAQVFAMTGYHPDFDLLTRLGIQLDRETRKPQCNPQTLESNVPGIYLAGVLIGGANTREIFIENGRFHARQIVASLTRDLDPGLPPPLGKRRSRLRHPAWFKNLREELFVQEFPPECDFRNGDARLHAFFGDFRCRSIADIRIECRSNRNRRVRVMAATFCIRLDSPDALFFQNAQGVL